MELDAHRVLSSPRAWKPTQQRHPWTGTCQLCAALAGIQPTELSEITGPGDYVAQLAAASFHAQLQRWLETPRGRLKPAACWRCPGCRKNNVRPLARSRITGAGLASSLGSPIHPQVILQVEEGPPVAISFGFPKDPRRPWAMLPLAMAGPPTLRVTPTLHQSHRLRLNGTNRHLAFICARCGADGLGLWPCPMTPCGPWNGEGPQSDELQDAKRRPG